MINLIELIFLLFELWQKYKKNVKKRDDKFIGTLWWWIGVVFSFVKDEEKSLINYN